MTKNWSIQAQDQNGRWFYVAGDMLECDARRWFATYCERSNHGDTLRLMRGNERIDIRCCQGQAFDMAEAFTSKKYPI